MRNGLGIALLALGIALASSGPAGADEPPCLEWGEVVAEDRGIGGTGFQDDRGVGGTGLADDRGVGGTGLDPDSGIGGTGLYGSITGFGSVCVNGIRVHLEADPVIDINGEPASEDELAVGQVVWIEARARGDRLEAERITAQSAVVGTVEAIHPMARQLEVAGEQILVPASARIVDAQGHPLEGLAQLVEGEMLDVSGLRLPDGRIVASRLERGAAPPLTEPIPLPELLRSAPWIDRISLEGHLSPLAAMDWVEVNGLPVEISRVALDRSSVGAVWVLGDVVDGEVRARRVTARSARRGARVLPRLRNVEPPLAASDRPDLFLPQMGGRGLQPQSPPLPNLGAPGAWTRAPVGMPQAPPPLRPMPQPRPIPIPRPVPFPIERAPQYGSISNAGAMHVLSR